MYIGEWNAVAEPFAVSDACLVRCTPLSHWSRHGETSFSKGVLLTPVVGQNVGHPAFADQLDQGLMLRGKLGIEMNIMLPSPNSGQSGDV